MKKKASVQYRKNGAKCKAMGKGTEEKEKKRVLKSHGYVYRVVGVSACETGSSSSSL